MTGLSLDANEPWKVGAYICILTTALLRGHEGFYLELAGLQRHLENGRVRVVPLGLDKSTILTKEMCRNLPHVTICFLGKFKGETGTDHHMIVVANTTVLGLEPRWWVKKLVGVCQLGG